MFDICFSSTMMKQIIKSISITVSFDEYIFITRSYWNITTTMDTLVTLVNILMCLWPKC